MNLIEKYLAYVRNIRRYSEKTVRNYADVLKTFCEVIHGDEQVADKELAASMNVSEIRSYEVKLLERGLSPKTVNLHLSALSGFCRYLMKEDVLASNPVKLVAKPKVEKRLPVFFKADAVNDCLGKTSEFFKPQDFVNGIRLEGLSHVGDPSCGQRLDDLPHNLAGRIGLVHPPHDLGAFFVHDNFLISRRVPVRHLTAGKVALQAALILTTADLLGQLCGVVFRQTDQNVFQDDTVQILCAIDVHRGSLGGRDQDLAVLL